MSSIIKESDASVTRDPRWAKIVGRDKSADGIFWYSVRTTGIYCRPSCPSRRARPENVQIHDSLDEARASGCRPCKKCDPEGASQLSTASALVARACRLIEESEDEPSLDLLADMANLSGGHFQRLFKRITGITPKDYATAHRAAKVRGTLVEACSVTEAIYDAGFNSTGRFYEKSHAMLGMTPSRYRNGGFQEQIRFAVGQSSFGDILVASTDIGIAAILLGDDADLLVRELQDRFPKADLVGADRDYEALMARVIGFVEAPQIGLDLPLDIRGTAFQNRVWKALQEIPFGTTLSYADLARRIGAPRSFRAVATACAANNIAVAIPCHRVVRKNGDISGYAWGVERKRALIEREAMRKR